MARYIDADDFLDLFYIAVMGQDKEFIKTVEMVLADTPTADVVEVVRCRDCKLRGTSDCPMYREEYSEWDDDGYTEVYLIVTDLTEDEGFCHCGKESEE